MKDNTREQLDFADIIGMNDALKNIAEVFLSGSDIVLVSPLGYGATMIARRLPTLLGEDFPFRAPHHTISRPEMAGEIALARDGVLFLDEITDFRTSVLEGLFGLKNRPRVVMHGLPCPCGRRGSIEGSCQCTEEQISSFQKRQRKNIQAVTGDFVQCEIPYVSSNTIRHGSERISTEELFVGAVAPSCVVLRRQGDAGHS